VRGSLHTVPTRGEPPHPPSLRSVDLSPHSPSQTGVDALVQGRGEVAADAGARLELTVRDDGFGIAADRPPGFGLRGMRERVQALGGDFAIETGSGRGTCVRIGIPLPSRPDGTADGSAAGSADLADYASSAP
jgi:hypothetical protein